MTVSMILAETTTIKCFSNQFAEIQDENCGPTGYCFIMRKDSLNGEGHYIARGCDHTFLCELIRETNGVRRVEFKKGIINYCMPDVQYMNHFGYFCCCNNSWCNMYFKAEEAPVEEIMDDLIQGTATKEKWQRLQEIAKKYAIDS